jgi:hypothetical protein
MAKYVSSLASKNKSTSPSPKPLKENSPKGKRRREEQKRRAERDTNTSQTKRPTQRAIKKAAGPKVQREKKVILPGFIFAGMTPRQRKQAKRRPGRIEDLLADHKAYNIQ